ncbi:hypothetical protein ACFLTD_03215 [Elusimicrobiota bacterium]
MPETFPGINFNEDNICNFCLNFKGEEKLNEEKAVYLDKFKKLIEGLKGKNDYDCTLSYSGGKDSTYTLYLLREFFKLRVLALTMDNSFMSDQAFGNIRTVTENLGVDSLVFKPDFKIMKKIFGHGVRNPMYSKKALERASTICTSCIGLVKFIFLKIALEKAIPIMAWGWSPGQAPIRSSIMKINPAFFKAAQKALKGPMREVAGDGIDSYFIKDSDFDTAVSFPYNVSPLAFIDYNEETIIEKIRELGWVAPEDVDTNSTNCLMNSFANQVHIDIHGFHPYVFEIAGMVRQGILSRDDGLKKIEEPGNDAIIDYTRRKLELKKEE